MLCCAGLCGAVRGWAVITLCHIQVNTLFCLQGLFKQRQDFDQEPNSSTRPLASDSDTSDPLNIINVALARQKAAVEAGCTSGPCADPTNLVNTLYLRHQTLLQHTQVEQTQQQQQDTGRVESTNLYDSCQMPIADAGPSAAQTALDEELRSPTLQGDTVPDTPVAAAANGLDRAIGGEEEDSRLGGLQAGKERDATHGIVPHFDADPAEHSLQAQPPNSAFAEVSCRGVSLNCNALLSFGWNLFCTWGEAASEFQQLHDGFQLIVLLSSQSSLLTRFRQ